MRVESSYPAPIHGVSTLAPRNRMKGHAGAQRNFRSDPVNKLTRRPPLQWLGKLVDVTSENILHHSYERDSVTFRFILDKTTGTLHSWVDGVEQPVLEAPLAYIGNNMVAQTVDDATFFVNQDKVVLMDDTVDELTISRYSHLNVTTALNYSESVKINVTLSTGVRSSVIHTVPALGITDPDYDSADAARATSKVASELATKLDLETGINAVALGSSVSVWADDGEWLDLEVESGQGDRSVVAVNRQVESTGGLPLFAKVGTRIKVRPDPTSDDGSYYLQAERSSDVPSGLVLEEVVWTESRSPTEPYKFDTATLPFVVEYDNGFTLKVGIFEERKAGDNESVPQPEFVNRTITNVGYFQKRLVLITGNDVVMSEAEEASNFWKKSAVQLLVTDKVSIASSAVGIDKLKHIVPHNRDLLVIASNSQFKIGGSEGITPQTVSMALTTRYECQVDVAPVSIGNSVFLPIDYGSSTGVQEYTGERNTSQDKASPITNHVVGYMQGRAKLIAASPNLEMIAVVTTEAAVNQLFVYEQFTQPDGSRLQKSWGQWLLSSDDKIIDLAFKNDVLSIVTIDATNSIILKEIKMYARISDTVSEIYLDDLVELDTDGYTATLPTGYDITGKIAIRGSGTEFELNKAVYSELDGVLTFNEFIGVGKVVVGKTYKSLYKPTRPFKYDPDGIAVTTDRIRISRFILNLVETNEVKMDIVSDYYSLDTQVFNSRFVGGLQNKLGEIPIFSGDYKFSFSQDANLAEAEFYCDNHLGCTIAGISWEGQYNQSKRRI